MSGGLAGWWQRLRAGASAFPEKAAGQVYVRRTWRYVELQFKGEVTQTRMLRWRPHVLHVGYTRTMLAALLLRPDPARVGIVGLGGGAQAKFCHRHLGASRVEAVESDAGVLALRGAFKIPPDDARLQVTHDDGARWLKRQRGRYDLLLVDAYDVDGIPSALSSQAFYADCQAALQPNGVMASNLYATDARRHLACLRRAFGGRVVVLAEPEMSNQVVFAWNGALPALDPEGVLRQLPGPARRQLRDGFRRLAEVLGRWRAG